MIYLFGDSYADINYSPDKWAWPRRLEKAYHCSNYGKAGTGPSYSLHRLGSMIESNVIKKDDILIFFVPEFFRTNFYFFKPEEQVMSYYTYDTRKQIAIDTLGNKNVTWLAEWWRFYQYYDYNDTIDVAKIFSLLNSYSQFFKKVLIINTDIHFERYEKTVNTVLNASNITFPSDIILDEISRSEPEFTDALAKFGKDQRSNHLSRGNHDIMYSMIVNWIESGVKPTNQFQTKDTVKPHN